MTRLTRAGVALTSAGFGLFALGVAMGNLEILLLAAFPLLLLALALAQRARAVPTVTRTVSTTTPRRGEPFSMDVTVRGVPEGALVEVHAPLPPGFGVEAGSNVALLDADGGLLAELRAHGRGHHDLPPVHVEAIDPTGVLGPVEAEAAPGLGVEVVPRRMAVRRARARARSLSTLRRSERNDARLGIESSDFRELREYAWGDPPNSINWKATARRLSALGRRGGRGASPLVNEYEKEGKRTVFVLLDAGEALRVGTTLETGLDHGVEAALSAARLLLARGARVGAWTFGARAGAVAPPEAGSGHAISLERALSPGEPDATMTLSAALRALHPHLASVRPLVLVVTRITPQNAPDLVEGARRLRMTMGGRGATSPLVVLDVRALDLAPAPDPGWRTARDLVAREDAAAAREVSAAGARVVAWRPGREDLHRALLRGGVA